MLSEDEPETHNGWPCRGNSIIMNEENSACVFKNLGASYMEWVLASAFGQVQFLLSPEHRYVLGTTV